MKVRLVDIPNMLLKMPLCTIVLFLERGRSWRDLVPHLPRKTTKLKVLSRYGVDDGDR